MSLPCAQIQKRPAKDRGNCCRGRDASTPCRSPTTMHRDDVERQQPAASGKAIESHAEFSPSAPRAGSPIIAPFVATTVDAHSASGHSSPCDANIISPSHARPATSPRVSRTRAFESSGSSATATGSSPAASFATSNRSTTPQRLIVAPEALSRFYVESSGKTHADTHVGASWMTREDRLSDIEDYVEYLDALHAHMLCVTGRRVADVHRTRLLAGRRHGRALARAHEACTSIARCSGEARSRPTSISRRRPQLRAARLTSIAGTADEHATPAMLAAQDARLRTSGIACEHVSFNGSHRIRSRGARTPRRGRCRCR